MASDRPTHRELQVLEAVCQPGGSIATAAHELDISPHTARHALRRLYARLGVSSAAQAAYGVWGRGRVADTVRQARGGLGRLAHGLRTD